MYLHIYLREVLERDDDAGGCLDVGDEGGVLALPRLLLQLRGPRRGQPRPGPQPQSLNPEEAVLHRVSEMLGYIHLKHGLLHACIHVF